RVEAADERAAGLRSELDIAVRSVSALEAELAAARKETEAVRAEVAAAQAAAENAARAPQPMASNELLMSLFQEMATMKANMQTAQAQAPAASGGGDLSAALDKLTSSLNDRLESFGKKMGISSAVESDVPTDFSGLFKGVEQNLESNMDNVKIKQKAGGGIAANLARLKKLKGGGE
ncbi:MAG: hypothetical protein KDE27_01145, partial [Planctomycetes bacterium]|nr:hypothetical protein [Planctomycetota bacterium]